MGFLQTGTVFNLDGKLIFQKWLELGTIANVSAYLASVGIVNQKSGKPYGVVVLSKTAWIYCFEHIWESYDTAISMGEPFDRDFWEKTIVEKAYRHYTNYMGNKLLFYDWLRDNNLYEKYKGYEQTKRVYARKSLQRAVSAKSKS